MNGKRKTEMKGKERKEREGKKEEGKGREKEKEYESMKSLPGKPGKG